MKTITCGTILFTLIKTSNKTLTGETELCKKKYNSNIKKGGDEAWGSNKN